jgi:hypothetical protein
VLLDLTFEGLSVSVEASISSGWFSLDHEKEWQLIEEKVLMSNHQAAFFSEGGR